MSTLINAKALIYLWTRDAKLPITKDTQDYVVDHILKANKCVVQFSDKPRLEMVKKILELV